jgi:hypothetical protein
MLGFQRLTYATGDRTFFPWLCLLCTHIVEAWFWWMLAIQTGALNGKSVEDFLLDVVSFKVGHPHFFFVLILVPLFVLLFFIDGPEKPRQKSTNNKHE